MKKILNSKWKTNWLTVVLGLLVMLVTGFGVTAVYAEESEVVIDISALHSYDWMSGISDERYLYELNIPGTHDSGCSNLWHRSWLAGKFEKRAYTQNLSIAEQLDAGIRLFDLRWTNCITDISGAKGDSIYNVHGAYQTDFDLDLMYYCTDEHGNYRTFENVMDDMRAFLAAHPTETLILNMQAEYEDQDRFGSDVAFELSIDSNWTDHHQDEMTIEEYAIQQGASGRQLEKLVSCADDYFASGGTEKTWDWNKYMYYHNHGVFSYIKDKLQAYEDIVYQGHTIPTLGEARGKIVFLCNDSYEIFGHGVRVGFGHEGNKAVGIGDMTLYYQNVWDKGSEDKWYDYIAPFYRAHPDLMPQIGEHTQVGFVSYSSGTTKSHETPREIASEINPKLYGQNGLYSEYGRHFGWVFSDSMTKEYAETLWKSNFPQGLQNCTVTYKTGFGDNEIIETQKVFYENYVCVVRPCTADPKDGRVFTGWKLVNETGTDEQIYQPGDTMILTGPVTLEAQWDMTWKGLKAFMESTEGLEAITLPHDIVAEADDTVINVNRNVTLNLNGYTVNGNAEQAAAPHSLFEVTKGVTFTINGSDPGSDSPSGLLTGGYSEYGGAIKVHSGATLNLKGLTISGNQAKYMGGAIYAGGQEDVILGANLNLTDTVITKNTAGWHGGGIWIKKILLTEDGTSNPIRLQGRVVINGNTVPGGFDSNLCVNREYTSDHAPFFQISGNFNQDSVIGFSVVPALRSNDPSWIITEGLKDHGSVDNFFADLTLCNLRPVQEGSAAGEIEIYPNADDVCSVSYNANGAVSGTVPETESYSYGQEHTVYGNEGNLEKENTGFCGWNTKADGTGDHYKPGDKFEVIGNHTLYAQWCVASVTTAEGKTSFYDSIDDALKAWGDRSTLKLFTDAQRQTADIYWGIVKERTLDLNGCGLVWEPSGSGRGIQISHNDCILNILDSNPSRTAGLNRPEAVPGGGYFVGSITITGSDTLNMHGGAITGNTAEEGGAVKITGNPSTTVFNMYGGTITGNTAQTGGGVYIKNGRFHMYGGTITGNTAQIGGGVYVGTNSYFEVGFLEAPGVPRVVGNYTKDTVPAANNVYLVQGGKIITFSNVLAEGASFGVTMEKPEDGLFTKEAKFTDNASAKKVFTSDDPAYYVERSPGGQAMLKKYAHITYTDHSSSGTKESKTLQQYVPLDANVTELSDNQWYVLEGDAVMRKPVTVTGNAHLIICDGGMLRAYAGIILEENSTLNIYPGSTGQTVEETGILIAEGAASRAGIETGETGRVIIHGGSVKATGGDYGAGIGGGASSSGGTVIVYDGIVFADGGRGAAGIGGGQNGAGGAVTIYGGTTKTAGRSNGSIEGAGIGAGAGSTEHGTLTAGSGMYVYGKDVPNPEANRMNHIPLEDGDYARPRWMTVNSNHPHEHSLVYFADGASLMAKCTDPACPLSQEAEVLATLSASEAADLIYDDSEKPARIRRNPDSISLWMIDDLWNHMDAEYQKNTGGEWAALPSEAAIPVDAGTYRVVLSLTGIKTEDGENQTVKALVEYTIAQRPVTVTAADQKADRLEDLVSAVSKAVLTGAVDGHVLGSVRLTFQLAAPEQEGVESYEGTIFPGDARIMKGDADVTGNYSITYGNGAFRLLEKAVAETPPTARELTYDESQTPQELVTAGRSSQGTLQYALGTDSTTVPAEDQFSETIPTGTEAGIYYVWYRVLGDAQHSDSDPVCLKVQISGGESAPSLLADTLKYTGKPQTLVTEGKAKGGELVYALGENDQTPPAENWSTEVPKGTEPGIYYVWYMVKGDKNHNDTEPAVIVVKILAPVSATVTFRVVNGMWDDATTADKTVVLSGFEGDVLHLTTQDIPAAGAMPGEGCKAGSWDVTPDTVTAIPAGTNDTTYTYTYVQEIYYFATEGANAVYMLNSAVPLRFTIKRSVNDNESWSHFTGAHVDGNLLTAGEHYTASPGSVIIELAAAYLDTLSAGNHTLTAEFNDGNNVDIPFQVLQAASCSVIFDMNGHGTAPEIQRIENGKNAIKPADPTADGYVFEGWYTDPACTVLFDFGSPITSDITLYAKWSQKEANQSEPDTPASVEPETGSPEPGKGNTEPGKGSTEPVTEGSEPVTEGAGPGKGSAEPVTEGAESGKGSLKPVNGNTKPVNGSSGTAPGKPVSADGTARKTPPTGDMNHAWIWILILMIAASAIVFSVVTILQKKKDT